MSSHELHALSSLAWVIAEFGAATVTFELQGIGLGGDERCRAGVGGDEQS